ncbi:MAG: hypothetical protein LBB89_11205 [Treponema sp.]|nr:hypothetical protein [Treponema sp.]
MTEEFNFVPPKDIGRNDRERQMDWATAAANYTTVYSCVRLFDDVCLYSQSAMKQYRGQFPEPDRDYSGAPYWLVKKLTGEVIPMHSVQDIAGFFYWNTGYWESMER